MLTLLEQGLDFHEKGCYVESLKCFEMAGDLTGNNSTSSSSTVSTASAPASAAAVVASTPATTTSANDYDSILQRDAIAIYMAAITLREGWARKLLKERKQKLKQQEAEATTDNGVETTKTTTTRRRRGRLNWFTELRRRSEERRVEKMEEEQDIQRSLFLFKACISLLLQQMDILILLGDGGGGVGSRANADRKTTISRLKSSISLFRRSLELVSVMPSSSNGDGNGGLGGGGGGRTLTFLTSIPLKATSLSNVNSTAKPKQGNTTNRTIPLYTSTNTTGPLRHSSSIKRMSAADEALINLQERGTKQPSISRRNTAAPPASSLGTNGTTNEIPSLSLPRRTTIAAGSPAASMGLQDGKSDYSFSIAQGGMVADKIEAGNGRESLSNTVSGRDSLSASEDDGPISDSKASALINKKQVYAYIRSVLSLPILEIGFAFNFGKGVERAPYLAVHYFEIASKLGDVEASSQLGDMYDSGRLGIKKDRRKAARYYRIVSKWNKKNKTSEVPGRAWIWKAKYDDTSLIAGGIVSKKSGNSVIAPAPLTRRVSNGGILSLKPSGLLKNKVDPSPIQEEPDILPSSAHKGKLEGKEEEDELEEEDDEQVIGLARSMLASPPVSPKAPSFWVRLIRDNKF